MLSSCQAFLSHLIDYAGMFPPAKLPLQEALDNYLHFRKTSPHQWMLGRFVCPAARLGDIKTFAAEESSLLRITALGQVCSRGEDFLPNFDTDVLAIQDFRRAWGSAEVVDALEFALPKDADLDGAPSILAEMRSRLAEAKLRGFLELPFQPSWRNGIEKLVRILRTIQGSTDHATIGLKLRSGGLAKEAFPSDEDVAHFVVSCRVAQLPWKATAGLHHPRRFWDASLNVWHHGFLNVFGAGLLALSQPLAEADIVQILADRHGEHFRFNAQEFAWKDWACPVSKIIEIRRLWVCSFGSCSFEEPCEELMGMGLIET